MQISEIAFQSSSIQVRFVLNAVIKVNPDTLNDAKFNVQYSKSDLRASLITVEEVDLNSTSPFIISKINGMLDQKLFRIGDLRFSVQPEVLTVKVDPEGVFETGINADFSIKYDHPNNTIYLEEMNISPASQANLVGRLLLKLLNSRIEAKVQSQFPLHLNQIIDAVNDNISKINNERELPFIIKLQDLVVLDLTLRQSAILLGLSYRLDLSSRELDPAIASA